MRERNLENMDLRGKNLSGWNLSRANIVHTNLAGASLRYADLSGATISLANMERADLRYANLRDAKMIGTSLRGADLSGALLEYADLSNADLSGAVGLLSEIDYMKENFEATAEGYIAYKKFGQVYAAPKGWKIAPGAVIEENVNTCRTSMVGCGIHAGTLKAMKKFGDRKSPVYRLLIRWEWLPGVVVPYATDGRIRCSRAQILGEVKKGI